MLTLRGKLILAGLLVLGIAALVWATSAPSRLAALLDTSAKARVAAEQKVKEMEARLEAQEQAVRQGDQRLTAERQRLLAAIAAKDRQIAAKDQEITTLHVAATAEADRRKAAEARLQAALAVTRTPGEIHEALRLLGHPGL